MSDNFMQRLVNEDYDTLLEYARISVKNLMPVLKIVDPEHEGVLMLALLIRTALGADGTLTALERKFVCEAFSLSEDSFKTILGMDGDEALVDKFADALPAEQHADVVMFITTIAACDKTIARDEVAFIQRVLK